MRTLVIGSTGYVGSRLIPELVRSGHTVIAGARDVDDLQRFAWVNDVSRVSLDVHNRDSVDQALSASDVDAVVYLVHGMGGDDFRATDRAAAERVRDLVTQHQVARVVYVSGIIPPIDESALSEHLTSRLEVERLLSESSATVLTLRAAMVIGAGSTSFELMAQLAQRLPVTVIPDWMHTRVEPIAIVDLVRAIVGALTVDGESRSLDVGGGEVLPYPELIERYTAVTHTERLQLDLPFLPEALVSKVASWIADVPSSTVVALMESLREDMVAADRHWIGTLVDDSYETVGVDEALRRSVAGDADDPMTLQPGDPQWAQATAEETS